jgi:hypothetical protein
MACEHRSVSWDEAFAVAQAAFERVVSLWRAAKNKWLVLLDVGRKEVTA